MLIHSYRDHSEADYPYVCAFYVPYDITELHHWLLRTYDEDDILTLQSLRWGELRFRREDHANWFRLRWAS
jgi:hypothetical protein